MSSRKCGHSGVKGTSLDSFEANMMVRLLEFVGFDR